MQFAGVLPEDAPDPLGRMVEQVRRMPIPILGLVPQRHLEDWGAFGIQSTGAAGRMTVSVGYTIWRNPDDRADPANLAELDDATRASLDRVPPWPRPKWLLEGVERMRYPMLWEAVQTTWIPDGDSREDIGAVLVHHVNYVLVNRFGAQYPMSPRRREAGHPLVDERSLERGVGVLVDGGEVEGIRVDTDPYVLGVGADLGAAGLLTAVIPRDDLPYVTLAFTPRPLPAAPA